MQQHHRRILLAAISLGVLIAMLGFGRARAAGPAWVPGATDSWQYQLSGRIDTAASRLNHWLLRWHRGMERP